MYVHQETIPDQIGPSNGSYLDMFIINEVSGTPTNLSSPYFEVFGTGGNTGYSNFLDPGYPALVGTSGAYHCRLTLSTGNGFELNKAYFVRIKDSSPTSNQFLKTFKITQNIPTQIFGAFPTDYSGEENFAEKILQTINRIGIPEITLAEDMSNIASDVWTANLGDFSSTPASTAEYLSEIFVATNETNNDQNLYLPYMSGQLALKPTATQIQSSVWTADLNTYSSTPASTAESLSEIFTATNETNNDQNTYLPFISGAVDSIESSGVPWNAAWDAEVQSEVTDALNAYDPPTKSELDTAVDNLMKENVEYTITTPNGTLTTTFGL